MGSFFDVYSSGNGYSPKKITLCPGGIKMMFASRTSSAVLIKFFMGYASFLIRCVILAAVSCRVSSRMIQNPALARSVSGYQ